MSKVYLGGVFTLLIILALGFWRYSAVVQQLGEYEQANHQFETTIKDLEKENQKLLTQQQQAGELSLEHHEKTLTIVRTEMQTKLLLLEHKLNKLRKIKIKLEQENNQFKSANAQAVRSGGIKNAVKDNLNEEKSEKCAETPIPEFYLKQL